MLLDAPRLASRPAPTTSVLRRAWTILREEGPLALWFRVLGETVYRRLLVLVLDLPPSAHPPVGITTRWLRSEETETYAAFHPAVTAEDARHRLAAGERCLLLETGGQTVHCRWVATKRAWIEYLGISLPLPDDTAYLYQTYTPPPFRGRGYATAAAAALGWALHQEGFRQVMGCLQPDRAVVYPPAYKAGYRPVGYIARVRFGPWRRILRWNTTRFPRYAPRPWVESRP